LDESTRKNRAQKRFGKAATAGDWMPYDCCGPVNCAGLVSKAKAEANAMIKTIPGISGSLDSLTVEDDAELVESHTRDMSDLSGVPKELLMGNDTVGVADDVHQQAAPDLPRSSMEQCTCCGRLTDAAVCRTCALEDV